MYRLIIETIAWIRAAPVLAYIWSRRGLRRLPWMFRWRYIRKHPEWIHALGMTISKEFKGHTIRYALFGEHGPEKDGRNPIWWETPLTYTLWFQEQAAFGIGLEFAANRIHIRQLQGVKGFNHPEDLANWPMRLVACCKAFAEEYGFKEVRLYRADQTIFYKYPLVERAKPGLTREETRELMRQHMRRRYDGTARRAKMKMKKKYGVWVNPNYKGRQ